MLTRSLSDTRGLFGTVYSSSPESKINVTVCQYAVLIDSQ